MSIECEEVGGGVGEVGEEESLGKREDMVIGSRGREDEGEEEDVAEEVWVAFGRTTRVEVTVGEEEADGEVSVREEEAKGKKGNLVSLNLTCLDIYILLDGK